MKQFIPALIALFLAAAPTFAGGVMVDLPYLTWPDNGTETVTPGCGTTTKPAPVCEVGH